MRRSGVLVLVLSALLAVLSLAFPAGAAPTFPQLTGRVSDAAGILPATTAAELERRLAGLEATTKIQLVVATVPDLQGLEIDEFGYQLGRAWGVGQKGTDNGAILIVAPTARRVRIEVGYGLEGVLTDALTARIIRQSIVPAFRQGDMAGGVVAGADALIRLLELPPAERAAAAQAAAATRERGSARGGGAPTWIWIVIIIVWLIFSIARRRRGSRFGSGLGSAIVWGPGLGGWGGGGSGGGFGGGGGFSGGGGSFGGGGSSGSW